MAVKPPRQPFGRVAVAAETSKTSGNSSHQWKKRYSAAQVADRDDGRLLGASVLDRAECARRDGYGPLRSSAGQRRRTRRRRGAVLWRDG